MEINWFIPLHGDGPYLASSQGARPTSLDYLSQVAGAVDALGYAGALLPIGRTCEDAWVASAALISATQRMKFIVALRPGGVSPTVAARMAATFDRLSQGRLAINAVSGADRRELAGDGVYLEHDERYAVTDEFLSIWKGLMRGDSITYAGKHLRVDDASLMFPPNSGRTPEVYFGGSSGPAIDVAARHADVYLTFGEPLELAREKLQRVKSEAERQGRTVRFGIRFHVIVREAEGDAWREAERLISKVTPAAIAKAQANLLRYESEGQRRMRELHNGDLAKLLVAPNLWAGIGLVRGYAGTALVGDPDQVAARIREYADAGFESFIFSGYPHLEEAYRFAELVFPKLSYAGFEQRNLRGEVMAHNAR
jgi:alkanesulfonate monooxygenase